MTELNDDIRACRLCADRFAATATLVPGTNGYAVLRIRREGSGILTSLTDADGLIEIGAGVEEVKEGDPVPYFSFAELGAL